MKTTCENKQKSTVKRFKIKRKQPIVNPQTNPENTQKTNNKQPEKHICNNRNPAPPCKPGFISRKRPNGSLCCYKDYTKPAQPKKFKIKRISKKANKPEQDTEQKKSKKIKKIVGKNLVKIIEKVESLDFPYKPSVYEDIDVKLDFTKLEKDIQKYILVLDKANLNFNFNRPLASKHRDKDSELKYLNNFFSNDMEKVMNDSKSRFYHYLVNVKDVRTDHQGNVKSNVLLLVRNQANYIRYALEIYNYPVHLRDTKHNLF